MILKFLILLVLKEILNNGTVNGQLVVSGVLVIVVIYILVQTLVLFVVLVRIIRVTGKQHVMDLLTIIVIGMHGLKILQNVCGIIMLT